MFFLFSWRAAMADISPHQLISVFAEMAFAAAYEQLAVHAQSWPREFAQFDKWIFCLRPASIIAG
jgi:hypothetical protein